MVAGFFIGMTPSDAHWRTKSRAKYGLKRVLKRFKRMKLLLGYGEKGQTVIDGLTEFNWTSADEPVNIDQIVCCSATSCGCDRSFHGIRTRGKTSRAIVAEIADDEFLRLCERVYTESMAKYRAAGIKESAARKASMYRKNCLVTISKYVAELPIGTVVRVKKDSYGDTYEMSHD